MSIQKHTEKALADTTEIIRTRFDIRRYSKNGFTDTVRTVHSLISRAVYVQNWYRSESSFCFDDQSHDRRRSNLISWFLVSACPMPRRILIADDEAAIR